MQNLTICSKEELLKLKDLYEKQYLDFKSKNFSLNMARGKPCKEQLDLSLPMLDELNSSSDFLSGGDVDCRNYGTLDGIDEIKEFISEATGIKKEYFIVGGNSSLSMMFDAISFFMIHGISGNAPWLKQGKIKFLCPSPGYDRHFAMCEYFGMDLIAVPMNSDGPDMDFVEKIVSNDSSVKGIWCVPKYSNPQGITYSNEVVRRLASLKPMASDFRIFWDNAYFVHSLEHDDQELLDIISECEKVGNDDLPIEFFSTSKITFAGSGVAFMACKNQNLEKLRTNYKFKTVGFDKINQLRHVRFLKNKVNLKNHMKKHAKIIKPKFDLVINMLENEFKDNPLLTWSTSKGGYFVCVNTLPGFAKKVVEMCKDVGVKLTKAGATFPYGNDPMDSNIRIAPTYPSLDELEKAMRLFCLVVKLAYINEKIA